MKISELSMEKVAGYLRIDMPDADEDVYETVKGEIQMAMDASLGYICSYTGRPAEWFDDYPETTYAFLALCADAYENRQTRLSQGQYRNDYVESILAMHSVNLLAAVSEGDDTDG